MPSMSLTEVVSETPNVLLSPERLLLEMPQGLHNSMAIASLVIWYISSGSTLFSNKYILSSFDGDAFSLGIYQNNKYGLLNKFFVLGMNQLVLSVLCGYIQMTIMNKISTQIHKNSSNTKNIFQDMIFIGIFRCATVVLGLVALKYIAVSFVATIKAASPLFTVIISGIMLGEKTGHWTKFSMVPITIGLALCSSFELSFNLFGFVCALGTNVFEW
jgi:solute carrier family 35 protein E2